jgi:ABC-type Zn uptake system ZnuABC Zn-binding protein ZnuA
MQKMLRLAAPLGVLLIAACAGRAPAPGKPAAAATIAPLADVLAHVAGPGWDVRTIVPPGVSPHVFEPTPGDVRVVARARLIVTVGAGFDGWAAKLAKACASGARLFDGGKAAGVVALGESEEAEEHAHGVLGHDPHWWLSPPLVEKILPALASELSALDPAGAALYRERAASYGAELSRLDAEIAQTLKPFAGSSIVTAHNAWTYFAERYGLKPVGSIEPVPGREASPREIRSLVLAARREGVRTLFTEPQFPIDAAGVIAGEAGLKVAVVDPIGGVKGRLGYEALLRYDARVFRDGLERR